MPIWQFTPFSALYFAGLVIALALAATAFRMRPVRGAAYFSMMAVSVACWIAGYILGFFNTDLAWKVLAVRIEYLGIIGAPVCFFLFVADYVQLRLPRGWQGFLLVPAAFMVLMVLTFPYHEWLYIEYDVRTLDNGFVIFDKRYGPLFYFWMAFAYVVMMASALVLAWGVSRMPDQYRFQATVLGIIIATIMISNVMFVSGLNPIRPYDPTPLSFLVASVMGLFNMRIYRFLDIVPVAHNLVFRQVPTGVVVLNEKDRVIDLNGRAERALGPREALLGAALSDRIDIDQPRLESVSLGTNREYDVEVTSLTGDGGQSAGRLVMIHDVTERNEMHRRQESLIAELRKALADVRVLEGMLPICANCKKIKSDEGNWYEIETFIDKHSQAQFSHGICPGCAKLLYPEYESE